MTNTFFDFPANLAKYVHERWETLVAGDYTPPPLPSEIQLQTLLEVAYLAGMETDEARPLRFTLCCTPNAELVHRHQLDSLVEAWPFAVDRPFNIQEIRRLAAVTNLDDSAIWIRSPESSVESLTIHGLLNLGSSWASARNAFTYHYDPLPEGLLVKVQAPGRISVYQGQFLIASLQSGSLQIGEVFTPIGLLGVYPLFQEGHDLLREEIQAPKHESPREWHEFEWLAYVNTILAVVNSIQLRGHGGAVIFANEKSDIVRGGFVKIKYSLPALLNHLKRSFIGFMTLRHQFGDMLWLLESGGKGVPTEQEVRLVDYMLQEAQRRHAETCEFIGNLSGTDGAIVLRTDLTIEGFGTEILLDKAKRSKVHRVIDPMDKNREELDSEQFGMRHRSAIRLCSAVPDLTAFVISQDGGVSLVWNDKGDTCFKSGVKTTNVNMAMA